MKVKLPMAVPQVPVSDLGAAIDHYREAFGLELEWAYEDQLAGMAADELLVYLCRMPAERAGTLTTWLALESREEVDALHDRWSAAGAKILEAPEDKPWDLHEFTAADRDGNAWRVFHFFGPPRD